MTFFRWIFSTLIAIIAVVFSVSNMQQVDVFYSPVDGPLSMPLSVIVLSALATGFILGGLMIWFQYGPFSKRADKKRAQVYGLMKDVKSLKEERDVRDNISTPLLETR